MGLLSLPSKRHSQLARKPAGKGQNHTTCITALRLYCTPRRKSNPGCGHTCAIHIATTILRHNASSSSLWTFLRCWRKATCTHAAWLEAQTGYSLDSAYRWIKSLGRWQNRLRELLTRARAPPKSRQKDALKGLLEHLLCVTEAEIDPIRQFQMQFQQAWFARPTP